MKLRELPYLLGLRPAPRTYGQELKAFDLPREGVIHYAQWLHPSETPKTITQESVDELRNFLSPGDVAIDIGAHTGDSTMPIALAVGAGGCVLALEPNRYVFPVLQRNAELNPGKTHIIPLMFAATPEDALLEFHYSDSGYCNGGRFEGMSKWRHAHAFELTVQGRNLYAFLKRTYPQLIPKIRYVKIDTEGYEAAVLRSISDLILQCKPYLNVEMYRKLDELKRRELFREIGQYGYTIHRIAEDGRYFGEVITEDDLHKWPHFDIFCTPDVRKST